MNHNIAIVLSGGVGNRMKSDIPKQYIEVNGVPVFMYSVKTIADTRLFDALVIGAASEWRNYIKNNIELASVSLPVFFSQPGKTRQLSVLNALETINGLGYDDGTVLVHDAARPLVSRELIVRCVEECRDADGVLPVISVKDTIYQSKDGTHIDGLIDRSILWNGQAPEAFSFLKYYKAHQDIPTNQLLSINGSTELAYKAGLQCKMIEGDPMNFKITTPEDLVSFQNIINNK